MFSGFAPFFFGLSSKFLFDIYSLQARHPEKSYFFGQHLSRKT